MVLKTEAQAIGVLSGKRGLVFIAILLTNFTVWLDTAKFGVLAPFWAADLKLTPSQISGAAASYLLGYFPLLLVAGILADRLGARRMLLICVAGVTVLSASMAFVHTYGELYWRNFVFGLFFGFLWAPCNRLLAMWFPGVAGTKVTSIWMSTTLLAGVFAPAIALPIANHLSWQLAFLIVAALGLPSFYMLWKFCADRPEDLPGITPMELEAIKAERNEIADVPKARLSFRELLRSLANPSVIVMAIATALATSPTWFVGTWVPYGLITLDKVNPDTVAWVLPLITLFPVIYGFFNGWIVEHVFDGRTKPVLALGAGLGAVGFILGLALDNAYWMLWAFAIAGIAFLCDPMFWGTINAYWARLVRPEATGTLNGLSAAMQVAVGWYILNQSGGWINTGAAGRAQLNTLWIVGAAIFVAAIIPILVAKGVRLQRRGEVDSLLLGDFDSLEPENLGTPPGSGVF